MNQKEWGTIKQSSREGNIAHSSVTMSSSARKHGHQTLPRKTKPAGVICTCRQQAAITDCRYHVQSLQTVFTPALWNLITETSKRQQQH